MERRIGRDAEDAVGRILTYGSSFVRHITMVPPAAFLESSGRSGLRTSSLLR